MNPDRKERLVVMTDAVMQTLLLDLAFVGRFPFLRIASEQLRNPAARAGCGKCGRAAKPASVDYSGLYQAIKSLNTVDQNEFKRKLNAERIRLYYKLPTGRVEKYTF